MVGAIAVGLATIFVADASRRLGWRLRGPKTSPAIATSAALLAGAIVCLLEALRAWGGFSPLILCLSAFALWLAAVYGCRPYPGSDHDGFSRGAWLYLGFLLASTSAAALVLAEVRGPSAAGRLLALWVSASGGPGRLATLPALAMLGAGTTLAMTSLRSPIGVAAPSGVILAIVPLLAPAGAISLDDLLAIGGAAILLGLVLAGLHDRPGRTGAVVGGLAAGLAAGSRSILALITIPLALVLIVELVRTVSSPKWTALAVSGFLLAAAATGLIWYLSPLAAAYPG